MLLLAAAPASADDDAGARALVNLQDIYGDIGGDWWVWVYDTGAEAVLAEGEVDCSVGQRGPVWFLAGTFGADLYRSCTIPRGKMLFIPLVNSLLFYEAGVDPVEFDLSIEQKRIWLDGRLGGGSLSDDPGVAALAELVGAQSQVACNLFATLDGEPLVFSTPSVRGQSGPVTITTDDEAIADGLYALIPPLDRGHHELSFGGGFCNVADGELAFSTSVTYDLYVTRR